MTAFLLFWRRLHPSLLTFALLLLPRLALSQDVTDISLFRSGEYRQDSDGEPLPIPSTPDEDPFTVLSVLGMSAEFLNDPDNLLFVSSVTLQPPGGALRGMEFFELFGGFVLFETFATRTGLENAFRAGTYEYTFGSLITGPQEFWMNVADGALPEPARILNFNAAQAVDPAAAFVLEWTPEAPSVGGARLEIYDVETGEEAYDSGPLLGPVTTAEIPAGTLQIGRVYTAEVTLTRLDVADRNSVPSLSAAAAAVTSLPLKTGSDGGGAPAILATTLEPDGSVRLLVECRPGVPVEVQRAEKLGSNWQTVLTETPESSPATWFIPAASLGDLSFLQVTQ